MYLQFNGNVKYQLGTGKYQEGNGKKLNMAFAAKTAYSHAYRMSKTVVM